MSQTRDASASEIVYAYVCVDDEFDFDTACVAFTSAERARGAAESQAHHDAGLGLDVDIEPIAWGEEHERRDGRYPAFSGKAHGKTYRVYPIEIMEDE